MAHKMHACTHPDAAVIIEAHRKTSGWPHDKVPLNVDYSRRKEGPLHSSCPYCGMDIKDMEDVPGEDVIALGKNLRASGTNRGTAAGAKNDNAALIKEVRAMREELARMKSGGKA